MRLPLLFCVTSLVATTVLAQQTPSSSPSSKSSQSSQPGVSSSSQTDSSTLSATGRGSGHAGQQTHFRSQKVIGAQVKSSSGEDIGRIEDVILNPATGRIDFAVISAENKLVPVPWQLISLSAQGGTSSSTSITTGTSTSTDPSSTTSPSSTSPSSTSPTASSSIYASASMGQPTFTLNVDKSKLQAGPSFDRSRWPEMSATWSQRIYSHYGVTAGSAVGGTGASSTTDQGSTGTSTDSSSGKSSSDKSDYKSDKSSDSSKSK